MAGTLSGKLSSGAKSLSGQLSSQPSDGYSLYTGDYEVTPKAYTQTLETAGKLLTENIVVTAVPYYETSNNSDGLTVYIAEEA